MASSTIAAHAALYAYLGRTKLAILTKKQGAVYCNIPLSIIIPPNGVGPEYLIKVASVVLAP